MSDDAESILQFAWPPSLVLSDAGLSPATVVQDSDDDIRSSAALLSEVRPGQLVWSRSTGTPSPLGAGDPDLVAASITAALNAQETRATVVARIVEAPGTPRDLRLRLLEDA